MAEVLLCGLVGQVGLAAVPVIVVDGAGALGAGIALGVLLALNVLAVAVLLAVIDDGRDAKLVAGDVVHVKGVATLGVVVAAGSVPAGGARRGAVAAGGGATEEGLEQRSEGGHTSGRDTETGLDSRPDGDISGGVQEVANVGQRVEVRETDNGCSRCTISYICQHSSSEENIKINKWRTHMQPAARMAATEILTCLFICRFQTRKTGRIE